jgi:hypothetical protein
MTWVRRSTIEYKPADFVAYLLVIQYKLADFAWKLCTLPLTLQATRFFCLTVCGRCAYGFDCIGGGTQFMSCYVSDHRRLASGVRCMPGRAGQVSGCSHSVTASTSGLHHRDLTADPGARLLDGLARTSIGWPHILKEVQYMLRAISRPYRKQLMIGVCEGAPAAYGDKAGIPLLW